MMKTCKKNTFEALDSYFLNTATMQMNEDYFRECIFTEIDVTYRSDKLKREYVKKSSVKSIVWTAFIDFTNDILEYNDYNTRCTNEHLKAYLKQYNKDYSIFDDLYSDIEAIKNELKEN